MSKKAPFDQGVMHMSVERGKHAGRVQRSDRMQAATSVNRKVKDAKQERDKSLMSKIDGLMHGRPPRFALVRTLGGLGDALMVTPTFKALKEKYPGCHIAYGTTKEYSGGVLFDILENNPYIDELVPYQQIDKASFDLYADLTSIGVKDEFVLDKPKDRQAIWANYVGVNLEDGKCIYVVEEDEKKWAKDWLDDHKKNRGTRFVFIQPGSFADRRNWPREKMIELMQKMHKFDKSIVFLVHDFNVGEYKDKWNSLPNTVNVSDFNIRSIAAIMEQSDLVIAHDSGMLHLAGALECKIVSIFGSTHPVSRINWFKNCIAVWQKSLACAPCVVGESRVLTADGYKNIDDIVIGDIIKTVDGEYNKTTEIHKNNRKDRDLIELSYVGSNAPITITDDHKMLVSKNNSKVFRKKDYIPNPEWTESKEINKRDFLCLPRNKEQNVNIEYDDPDMFWLYGLYIAEGYTHHRKTATTRAYYTAFIVSEDEAETVRSRVQLMSDKYFGGNIVSITNNKDRSSSVTFCCKEFTEHIIKNFGKNKAINKNIPSFIAMSSDVNLKAFIDGAMFGDGYSPKDEEHVYTTASKDLAYGFQELYTRFGILAKVYKRQRDTNYKKNTTIYRVYINQKQKCTRWFADNDYIYTPVKDVSVSNRKDEFVYDITVENSTTFTIDNVATWDCWYKSCGNHYYCMKALDVQDVYGASLYMLDKWDSEKARGISKLVNVDYFYGSSQAKSMTLSDAVNFHETFPVRQLSSKKLKSSCRLSILMVTMDNYKYLKNTIDDILKYTEDFELLIYQNARDNSSKVSGYLDKLAKDNKNIKLIKDKNNAGFLEPNNLLATKAKGEYICLLNDDMSLCKDWAKTMTGALESNETLAQVGVDNTCTAISHDGCGIHGNVTEYIEASCMVMPRKVYNRYGLFDEKNLHFAYHEDSDLSLRLREHGWNVATIDVPIVHHREKTSSVIAEDLKGYQAKNRNYFLGRWQHYLENRNFNYKIGIQRLGAVGDVLLTTPIIEGIKNKYPLSNITIITKCPEILAGNKHIHKCTMSGSKNKYDMFYNLDDSYENIQNIHVLDAYADSCGLDRKDIGNINFSVDSYNINTDEDYIVMHTGPTAWAGRNWRQDRFDKLAKKIKTLGYKVVLIGTGGTPEVTCDIDLRGKTNFAQTGSVIKQAKCFVGIDSSPFHIAQSQNTPSVVFFGCINPEHRIVNDNVIGVNAKDLACIGCHHWKSGDKRATPTCVREGGERCIEDVTVDMMYEKVLEALHE